VETRILFEAEAQVAAARAEGGEPAAYVLAGDGWHPGVIGIVASRIAERHHRPGGADRTGRGRGTGSGRSIPAFDLLGGLNAASADLLRHGGHRAAAGLTIARSRVDAFREAFQAHAAATLRPEDLVPVQRVDAVVPGDALHLGLAEELDRLAPFGMGNPEPTLLVPGALLDDPRPMGEGRHVTFTLAAGGARSRCVAFGRGSGLPAPPGEPVDAAVKLEINRYNGAVEPRLILRHARPGAPAPIEVVGEVAFEPALLAELDADLEAWRGEAGDRPVPGDGLGGSGGLGGAIIAARLDGAGAQLALGTVAGAAQLDFTAAAGASTVADDPRAAGRRAVVDARGGGIAGLLGDLVAAGAPVLAVAAHARHRAAALRDRVGGFAVTTWAALADDPALAAGYTHVVAVDPPPHPGLRRLAGQLPGQGWTHLAWGDAEAELARRVLAWELDLRPQLTELYRALRTAVERPPAIGAAPARVAGDALQALLRGSGPQPRSGALAGRLLRVLAELDLVELERAPLAVRVPPPSGRTQLERSPAFRAYAERLAAGLAHLGPVQAPPSPPARGRFRSPPGPALRNPPRGPRRRRGRSRPWPPPDPCVTGAAARRPPPPELRLQQRAPWPISTSRPPRTSSRCRTGRTWRSRGTCRSTGPSIRTRRRPRRRPTSRRPSTSCSPTCSRSSRSTPTRSPARSTAGA
jgi:single-stranded-DNA-specific exonuclease